MEKIYFSLICCALIFVTESQISDKTKPASEFENVLTEDGYHFRYKTDDSERTENGVFDNSQDENGKISVRGSYQFQGTDGRTYEVNFVADENGYRPMIKYRAEPVSVKETPMTRGNLAPYLTPATIASLNGGGLG